MEAPRGAFLNLTSFRFENQARALLDYEIEPSGVYEFYHTETPVEKRGKGYAAIVTTVRNVKNTRKILFFPVSLLTRDITPPFGKIFTFILLYTTCFTLLNPSIHATRQLTSTSLFFCPLCLLYELRALCSGSKTTIKRSILPARTL